MTSLEWWQRPRTITICVDTPGWFDPFAEQLARDLASAGDDALFVREQEAIREGDVAFLLSCTRLTSDAILRRNRRNIVVHASALPEGRGFSPVVWQILEGKNVIPITMIEASAEADAGDTLMSDEIVLEGHELNAEIRRRLGEKVVGLCRRYLDAPAPAVGEPQRGEGSRYRRRTPADSALDPHRSIAEQFDLLRVVDNERYPAYFDYRGKRYILTIKEAEPK
jgi:methionyl-tRNA formyltransferase